MIERVGISMVIDFILPLMTGSKLTIKTGVYKSQRWQVMNGIVVDDRKRIHTGLRHFAHALKFAFCSLSRSTKLKQNSTVETGVQVKHK